MMESDQRAERALRIAVTKDLERTAVRKSVRMSEASSTAAMKFG